MKFLFLSLISSCFFNAVLAQKDTVYYEVNFPNAIHHEAQISLSLNNISDKVLTFRMSRSSPGRYATHEFGKNVYAVKALDAAGKEVAITQVAGDVYEVQNPPAALKITYTIFGNWVDGTYLAIDETHAHLNMPATFMWVLNREQSAVSVTFNDLEKYNWKVATQLKTTSKSQVFTAPSLAYFMDSPTELAAFKTAEWQLKNPDNTTQKIMVMSHTADKQTVVDGFAKMLERLTKEEQAVFKELPNYDYGEYRFIHDVNSDNDGDGMEHRNSTIITETADKISGNETDMLSTFSHEYFHSWNVERIRPKNLEPFNLQQANMSDALWFAEGFTQYYGELLIKRAAFKTVDDYTKTLSGLLNNVLLAPGAATFSPVQMSKYAVFADAGVAVDKTNQLNIFTSYYTYGAVMALALDLQLRAQFSLTLDDFMRLTWKKYGKTEVPYTVNDLQTSLAELTNKAFADDFFTKYINGIEKPDFALLLQNAGLYTQLAASGKATAGYANLVETENGLKLASGTLKGSALYNAGLDDGDEILSLDDKPVKTINDYKSVVQSRLPGDEINVIYNHRGNKKIAKLTLQENKSVVVKNAESLNLPISKKQKKFRNQWLESQIK